MTDDTANAHDVVHKRPVLDHAPADPKLDEVHRFQQQCETRFAAARLEEVMRGDPPLRVRQIVDYMTAQAQMHQAAAADAARYELSSGTYYRRILKALVKLSSRFNCKIQHG